MPETLSTETHPLKIKAILAGRPYGVIHGMDFATMKHSFCDGAEELYVVRARDPHTKWKADEGQYEAWHVENDDQLKMPEDATVRIYAVRTATLAA